VANRIYAKSLVSRLTGKPPNIYGDSVFNSIKNKIEISSGLVHTSLWAMESIMRKQFRDGESGKYTFGLPEGTISYGSTGISGTTTSYVEGITIDEDALRGYIKDNLIDEEDPSTVTNLKSWVFKPSDPMSTFDSEMILGVQKALFSFYNTTVETNRPWHPTLSHAELDIGGVHAANNLEGNPYSQFVIPVQGRVNVYYIFNEPTDHVLHQDGYAMVYEENPPEEDPPGYYDGRTLIPSLYTFNQDGVALGDFDPSKNYTLIKYARSNNFNARHWILLDEATLGDSVMTPCGTATNSSDVVIRDSSGRCGRVISLENLKSFIISEYFNLTDVITSIEWSSINPTETLTPLQIKGVQKAVFTTLEPETATPPEFGYGSNYPTHDTSSDTYSDVDVDSAYNFFTIGNTPVSVYYEFTAINDSLYNINVTTYKYSIGSNSYTSSTTFYEGEDSFDTETSYVLVKYNINDLHLKTYWQLIDITDADSTVVTRCGTTKNLSVEELYLDLTNDELFNPSNISNTSFDIEDGVLGLPCDTSDSVVEALNLKIAYADYSNYRKDVMDLNTKYWDKNIRYTLREYNDSAIVLVADADAPWFDPPDPSSDDEGTYYTITLVDPDSFTEYVVVKYTYEDISGAGAGEYEWIENAPQFRAVATTNEEYTIAEDTTYYDEDDDEHKWVTYKFQESWRYIPLTYRERRVIADLDLELLESTIKTKIGLTSDLTFEYKVIDPTSPYDTQPIHYKTWWDWLNYAEYDKNTHSNKTEFVRDYYGYHEGFNNYSSDIGNSDYESVINFFETPLAPASYIIYINSSYIFQKYTISKAVYNSSTGTYITVITTTNTHNPAVYTPGQSVIVAKVVYDDNPDRVYYVDIMLTDFEDLGSTCGGSAYRKNARTNQSFDLELDLYYHHFREPSFSWVILDVQYYNTTVDSSSEFYAGRPDIRDKIGKAYVEFEFEGGIKTGWNTSVDHTFGFFEPQPKQVIHGNSYDWYEFDHVGNNITMTKHLQGGTVQQVAFTASGLYGSDQNRLILSATNALGFTQDRTFFIDIIDNSTLVTPTGNCALKDLAVPIPSGALPECADVTHQVDCPDNPTGTSTTNPYGIYYPIVPIREDFKWWDDAPWTDFHIKNVKRFYDNYKLGKLTDTVKEIKASIETALAEPDGKDVYDDIYLINGCDIYSSESDDNKYLFAHFLGILQNVDISQDVSGGTINSWVVKEGQYHHITLFTSISLTNLGEVEAGIPGGVPKVWTYSHEWEDHDAVLNPIWDSSQDSDYTITIDPSVSSRLVSKSIYTITEKINDEPTRRLAIHGLQGIHHVNVAASGSSSGGIVVVDIIPSGEEEALLTTFDALNEQEKRDYLADEANATPANPFIIPLLEAVVNNDDPRLKFYPPRVKRDILFRSFHIVVYATVTAYVPWYKEAREFLWEALQFGLFVYGIGALGANIALAGSTASKAALATGASSEAAASAASSAMADAVFQYGLDALISETAKAFLRRTIGEKKTARLFAIVDIAKSLSGVKNSLGTGTGIAISLVNLTSAVVNAIGLEKSIDIQNQFKDIDDVGGLESEKESLNDLAKKVKKYSKEVIVLNESPEEFLYRTTDLDTIKLAEATMDPSKKNLDIFNVKGSIIPVDMNINNFDRE